VPDYSLRYGTRKASNKRIPGMPSLADGPSICLGGGSRTKDTEHNQAHRNTDPKVSDLGQQTNNGPLGVAPIGDIIEISVEAVSEVMPHCADEIKEKVDDAFKNVDRNKYGRTTQQPPKEGSPAKTTLEKGSAHSNGGNKGRIRIGRRR